MPETTDPLQKTSEKPPPEIEKEKEKEDELGRISWHPLKVEPRRLALTGDKPMGVIKGEVEVRSNENPDFLVKNRGDCEVLIDICDPLDSIDWSFEEMMDVEPKGVAKKYKSKVIRPDEIMEIRIRLKDPNVEDWKHTVIKVMSLPLPRNYISIAKETVIVAYRTKEEDRWTVEETKEAAEKRKKEEWARWLEEDEAAKKLPPERIREILEKVEKKKKAAGTPGTTGTTSKTSGAVEKATKTKKNRQEKCTVM